jgi:antitoxin HicB
MLTWPATIKRDGDTFVVLFPDVPHAHTNGNSREDALGHAPDALLAGLSMLMEKNLDIPVPSASRARGTVQVGLPSVISSAKVELHSALRSRGVRKAELGRRMGIHKQQVERLMDLDHSSRIEQLEAAFAALGMRLTVDIRQAAA